MCHISTAQHFLVAMHIWDSQVAQWSTAKVGGAEEVGSIPGSGRSPRRGNGNSLQYSCPENSMNRRAWQATVNGMAKTRTRLSVSTAMILFLHYYCKNATLPGLCSWRQGYTSLGLLEYLWGLEALPFIPMSIILSSSQDMQCWSRFIVF